MAEAEAAERAVHLIAAELGEETATPFYQIMQIIELRGIDFARRCLAEAEAIHANGLMLVADGSRSRTLGGIFFRLVREQLSPEEKRLVFGRRRSGPAPSAEADSAGPPSADRLPVPPLDHPVE